MTDNLKFLVLSMLLSIMGNANAALDIEFEIEQEIEKIAKSQITNLVPADKIFFQIQVTEPIKLRNQDTGQKLPYTQLDIDSSSLERLYLNNRSDLILTTPVSVNVVMDTLISDDIARLIEDKLTKSLRLNTDKRTIKIDRASFDLKPAPAQEKEEEKDSTSELMAIEAERAKLEAEKARLETERSKLEVARQIGNTDQEKAELLKKIDETEAEMKRLQEELKKPKEKTTLDVVEDFQLAILAGAIALAIIVASLLGFLGRGKGPDNVSQAIDHVAEGLNTIASSQAQAEGSGSDTDESEKIDEPLKGSEEVTGSDSGDSLSAHLDQEKIAESLKLIEEKIKILSSEGNFSFYSNLIEIIESRIEYAAALIVATPSELARQLLSNIPPSYMERMRKYLSIPGAVTKAKKMRVQALQEFYGKIALDEYIGSPLLEVNNIDWLIKLDNEALISLIADVNDEDRARVLACLSPSRVNLMLESGAEQEKLAKIINSLKEIKGVGFSDIPGLFDRMKEVHERAKKDDNENWRKMVDAPRYLAEILSSASDEKKETILKSLSDDKELMSALRTYFIPISDLALVSDLMLKDIFASRSGSQIALVVFDLDQVLKDRILGQLPDVLKETVIEEIDALTSNEENKVQNTKKSKIAKSEIAKTLLKMYRDGILKFEESPVEGGAADSGSAVA